MTLILGIPKFYRTQLVYFIGGEGIICSAKAEAGHWIYLVEMALDPQPACGRVGDETMVMLNERDLRSQTGC